MGTTACASSFLIHRKLNHRDHRGIHCSGWCSLRSWHSWRSPSRTGGGERRVTFPPGRGRLATSPVAMGSPVSAMTIGISRVACCAARAVGVNQATMTSTLRRTSSAANSGSRFTCPSADRNSNRMFCPSTYPRSRSACRNSRQNCPGSVLPMTSAPMIGSFAGCCARAASGHATVAPPIAAINSRRLIVTGVCSSYARAA